MTEKPSIIIIGIRPHSTKLCCVERTSKPRNALYISAVGILLGIDRKPFAVIFEICML